MSDDASFAPPTPAFAVDDPQPVAPPNAVVRAIRLSLHARVERLLARPLIARVGAERTPSPPTIEEDDDGLPAIFGSLGAVLKSSQPAFGRWSSPWTERPDGCTVEISIDYADLWRGCEKEVLDAVEGTVEGLVTFLTDEQHLLLRRSPREFLALMPRPEVAELIAYRKVDAGGSVRVVELTLSEAPRSPDLIRHIAVVPNLVPLERQLAGLAEVERASDVGPLAPLRALLGLCPADALGRPADAAAWAGSSRLDEYQAGCVDKALQTPHFSVIQGPPGSGKTTVITSVVGRVVAAGGKVLVVSPTHVAVDNVVEKLASVSGVDTLEPHTLPVRVASRPRRLSEAARQYWVSKKRGARAGTLSLRMQAALSAHLPVAKALYARVDDTSGVAPLTVAVAGVEAVVCGTPIGILSDEGVKAALPGSFDLLVVDEVSKMTLPEFLAVAVKARRWLLVGDPEQLPPFVHAEECGVTVDDVIDPRLELVCSLGGLLNNLRPELRRNVRWVVVSSAPDRVAEAARAHLAALGVGDQPNIAVLEDALGAGVICCSPEEAESTIAWLKTWTPRDRTWTPDTQDSVRVLVERGLSLRRPAFASGARLVDGAERAQARLFNDAAGVYHAQPWALRARQKLSLVAARNGLDKSLPSAAALSSLRLGGTDREALVAELALRFAVNTVSVYDWLVGVPSESFDTSPLRELGAVAAPLAPLRAAVAPFLGTLKKQYRMHHSLSKVPRDLFYFGEAMLDGLARPGRASRLRFVQVSSPSQESESNRDEAEKICELLEIISDAHDAQKPASKVMVITPYRAQERLLGEVFTAAGDRLANVVVEVCTIDRCQGREAEHVFISLVRRRATTFLDAPKRWNVALTRAMQSMFIVGDIEAYLHEARGARRAANGDGRPRMSLVARILEAYHAQLEGRSTPGSSS